MAQGSVYGACGHGEPGDTYACLTWHLHLWSWTLVEPPPQGARGRDSELRSTLGASPSHLMATTALLPRLHMRHGGGMCSCLEAKVGGSGTAGCQRPGSLSLLIGSRTTSFPGGWERPENSSRVTVCLLLCAPKLPCTLEPALERRPERQLEPSSSASSGHCSFPGPPCTGHSSMPQLRVGMLLSKCSHLLRPLCPSLPVLFSSLSIPVQAHFRLWDRVTCDFAGKFTLPFSSVTFSKCFATNTHLAPC